MFTSLLAQNSKHYCFNTSNFPHWLTYFCCYSVALTGTWTIFLWNQGEIHQCRSADQDLRWDKSKSNYRQHERKIYKQLNIHQKVGGVQNNGSFFDHIGVWTLQIDSKYKDSKLQGMHKNKFAVRINRKQAPLNEKITYSYGKNTSADKCTDIYQWSSTSSPLPPLIELQGQLN